MGNRTSNTGKLLLDSQCQKVQSEAVQILTIRVILPYWITE
jgi:hypothetical protein